MVIKPARDFAPAFEVASANQYTPYQGMFPVHLEI